MIYTFMFIVIIATISLLFFFVSQKNEETKSYIFALIVILQFCHAALLVAASMQPRAIDVYRGKTTLKVEYVDGIAQDSVVVYKEKVQPKNK